MLQERQLEGSFEKTPYFYLQLQKWLNDNIGGVTGVVWSEAIMLYLLLFKLSYIFYISELTVLSYDCALCSLTPVLGYMC